MVESKWDVNVKDINMPFWSMVSFMIKWAIASIPAIIVIGLILAVVGGFFGSCVMSMVPAL